MLSVRHFILGLFVVVAIAGTAIYSSCSKSKDSCSGITCNHGGSCSNGVCTCPAGLGGSYCDTVFRTTYANIYTGNGTDNESPARAFNNYRVTLNYNNDAVYAGMTLQAEIVNGAGNYKTHFNAPIVLSSCTSSGSQFTITPTVNANGFRISGSGTISTSVVSMTVNEADTATTGNVQPTIVYTFGTLNVQ